MEYFIKWLENDNEIYLIIFLSILGVIVIAVIALFIISYLQGRKVSFIPLAIGEKPPSSDVATKQTSISNLNTDIDKVFDLFISAPMTSVDENEYKAIREDVIVISQHFKTECGVNSIHYVGERVSSPNVADPPAISIEDDLNNLAMSKCYILIYPRPLLTSCIVEAGYALGMGIPSIYFVKNRSDLPYMLREAVASSKNSVSIYEYKDTDDLVRLIDQLNNRLFKKMLGK